MSKLSRDHRNFCIFALHYVVIRTGWIFKTETVIMPGFLDAMGAGGAVRGCLPVLGRIGQSVPQFLLAHRVRALPRHKGALALVTLSLGLPWLLLALMVRWWPGLSPGWAIGAFLVLYAAFYVTFGNWLLLTGTAQGKLIPAQRRGRLLGVSHLAGCGMAAIAAAVWLGQWLELGRSGYCWVFGVVAAAFLLAGLLVLGFDEPDSQPAVHAPGLTGFLRDARQVLVRDRNFRRLLLVVALYHMVLILFPHYAVFGRNRLFSEPISSSGESTQNGLRENPGLEASAVNAFVLWVIVQNLTNGFGSAAVGPMADRRGNRLALSMLMLLAATTPLAAITLAHVPLPWGQRLFWVVFVLLGFAPITSRIITNYTLEISPPSQHALYLGTLNLIQAGPLLLAPFFGWLIDRYFEWVFAAGSASILLAGLLARRLAEPRVEKRGAQPVLPVASSRADVGAPES